jgi:hypothetical protein
MLDDIRRKHEIETCPREGHRVDVALPHVAEAFGGAKADGFRARVEPPHMTEAQVPQHAEVGAVLVPISRMRADWSSAKARISRANSSRRPVNHQWLSSMTDSTA